jgi:hypothetical protein
MTWKTILLVASTVTFGFSSASCRPGPVAMAPAAAIPQAIAQAPPPPPPPGGAGYSTPAPPPPPPPGPRSDRTAWAPPPPPPGPPGPPPSQTSAVTTTIQGTVRSSSYGPAGEVNGVILDQGAEIHVPPDQANQLNSLAPIGTRIQASGWIHTGPLGDTHVDATTITNLNTRGTVSFATPPPPPAPGTPPVGPPPDPNAAAAPPPRPSAPPLVAVQPGFAPPTSGTDRTITGVVRSFNYGPAGDVNGLILDQGSVVYFPPEQSGQVTQLVQVGSRIRVRGWVRQGPTGNALVGAETITNRATGNSISVADKLQPR